jgi:ketosteroid isomerase-like protein
MDRADVERWVDAYVRVWRTPGTEALGEIFTDDATYLPSPWTAPVTGLDDLARFWEAERDGPDEVFAMSSEVVALDGPTAIVRAQVDYADNSGRWRDLWVLRFAEDGRCAAFEEWPFAPDQPDGH